MYLWAGAKFRCCSTSITSYLRHIYLTYVRSGFCGMDKAKAPENTRVYVHLSLCHAVQTGWVYSLAFDGENWF